jgi:hypothetical protein
MMDREKMAFELLKLMISHDWKFDLSDKDWDTQAVQRAFKIADLMIEEGAITNVRQ